MGPEGEQEVKGLRKKRIVRRADRRAIAELSKGSYEDFVPAASVPDDLLVDEGDGVAVKPTPKRTGFVRRHDEETAVGRKLLSRFFEDRAHGFRAESRDDDDVDLPRGQGGKAAASAHFQLLTETLAPKYFLQVPYHVGQHVYPHRANDATASEEGARK